MSSISFGDTMVPKIEWDYILLFGYSILYKEYDPTRFNHPKKPLLRCSRVFPKHPVFELSKSVIPL